ncbi:MAG: hydrogenase maturation protease [Verrucomicrobia bacterium]|nr:hydrogenase maturation protease [Verrucomicrobiota bacterium]
MSETSNRILLLGLGNDILTDDAVGLNVVREVRQRLGGAPGLDIQETMEMGLTLLDFIVGYRALVLVDSIQTGTASPGHLHEIDAASLKLLPTNTPHFLGIGETLALGRKLGLPMPEEVRVFAIEVGDPFTLGTSLTPALQEAFPNVVERVVAVLEEMLRALPTQL